MSESGHYFLFFILYATFVWSFLLQVLVPLLSAGDVGSAIRMSDIMIPLL